MPFNIRNDICLVSNAMQLSQRTIKISHVNVRRSSLHKNDGSDCDLVRILNIIFYHNINIL